MTVFLAKDQFSYANRAIDWHRIFSSSQFRSVSVPEYYQKLVHLIEFVTLEEQLPRFDSMLSLCLYGVLNLIEESHSLEI